MRVVAQVFRMFVLLAGGHAVTHPVRTVLTVMGVALGVAAPVAINLANGDVLRAFQRGVVQVAGPATLEVSANDSGLEERLIQTIREHAAVTSAVPILQRTMRDVVTGQTVTVIGTDLLDVATVKPLRWRQSRPEIDDGWEDRLYIGRRLADRWGVSPGATRRLEIEGVIREVRIGGVVEGDHGPESVWEELALLDIAPAQEWFHSVGRLDRIDVATDGSADVGAVQRGLERTLPPGVVVQRPVRRGEQVEALVAAFRLNLLMLSGVGLVVGGFLIYNTLSFSVVQRRRDIGILRAIGLSELGIRVLFLAEGLGYGLVGGWVGSLGGAWLAQALVGIVGRTITELYATVGETPVSAWTLVRWGALVAQGAVLGVAVSLIGAVAPSREASRTSVVGALAPGGYELVARPNVLRRAWVGVGALAVSSILAGLPAQRELPVFGYVSVLGLLLGLSALAPACVVALPAWLGWVRRSLPGAAVSLPALAATAAARAPRRNGVAVSSLLVGVSIAIGVLVMIHSFRQTVELWVDQTVMAELIVTPDGWLRGGADSRGQRLFPRSYAERIQSLPGIAAVDTYRHATVTLGGRSRALVARDLRIHAVHSRYLFVHGESRDILTRAAAEQGVILSEVLANALEVHEGSDLRLPTPQGLVTFRVAGIFYDYATDGGKIVMDRALFRSLWGDDSSTVIPVYLQAGEEPQAVGVRIEEALAAMDDATRPVAVVSNRALREEILAIFDRTFRVTYVLELIAIVIAIFGMINTLLTAALERRRELATLQAVGASARQLVRLLLWEAGYLGALGGCLGLLGGVWLAAVLVWVINKQSFGWTIPLSLPFGTLALAPVLAVGIGVLAAYGPARWIARQPAAEGLRYE